MNWYNDHRENNSQGNKYFHIRRKVMNTAIELAVPIKKIMMHFVVRYEIEDYELFTSFFLGMRILARINEIAKTTIAPVTPAAIVDTAGDSIPKNL